MEKNIRNSTGGRDSNEHKMPEDINRLSEALNDVDAVMGFKQFLDKIHSTEHLYFWFVFSFLSKLFGSSSISIVPTILLQQDGSWSVQEAQR